MSRDPFNAQLIRAYKYCNEAEETNFPALIRGELAEILAILPPEETTGAVVVSKLQAIVKGALERTGLLLGVGANKANTRPMAAKVGVLLHGMPLLLKVQANWMGKVSCIKVYDICKDKMYKVKLRTPFTPTRETGAPRKLQLTLQLLKHALSEHEIRGGATDSHATQLVMMFTDHENGHYSYRRMRLDLLIPKEGAGFDDRSQPTLEVQLEDLSMAEHRSILALPEQPSLYNTLLQESMVAMYGSAEAPLTVSDILSPTVSAADAADGENRRLGTTHGGLYTSVEDEVFSVISVTNALTVELVKEAFQHKGRYYLARVVNEHDVTQVTIMQLHSDRLFVFLMAREHIDRAHSLAKRWTMLMNLLELNPATAPMVQTAPGGVLLTENFSLLSGPSELYSSQSQRDDQARMENPLDLSSQELQKAAAALHSPLSIMGLQVYTSMLPRGNGVSIILVSPNNQPIIGIGLEVVDTADANAFSVSLLRNTMSHKVRSEYFVPEDRKYYQGHEQDQHQGHHDEADAGAEAGVRESKYEQDKEPERIGFEEDSFEFDYVPVNESGEGVSEKIVRGEGSAYELLGGAAAVRHSGHSDQFALTPEEYALMLQQQENGLLMQADSDMTGLRFGGALDDDSVSQILWGGPSGNVSPVPPGRSEVSPPARFPSDNAFEKDALNDLAETMNFIATVAAQPEEIPAFTLKLVAPVEIPADNRLVVARKSISLGMNLGAALTAALTSGDKKATATAPPAASKRRHSSAQQHVVGKPPVPHKTKETDAISTRRRSSVSKHREAVMALIKVKSAALALTSMAVGTALISATAVLAGESTDHLDVDVVPAPFVPALSFELDAIHEGEEEDSRASSVRATVEAARVSTDRSGGTSVEDDWIARLFKEAEFPDSADASVQGDVEHQIGIAEQRSEGEGADEGYLTPIGYSASDAGSECPSDEDGAADDDDVPVQAEEIDIEWIVELGSSGAVDDLEELILEELLVEGVKYWSEVYSDQIPPLRDPVVEESVIEALHSVVDFNVHAGLVAAELLEREVKFQSTCVTLVQMLETVSLQGACKKILATEKQQALALKRQANEEKARLAAENATRAAALTVGTPPASPTKAVISPNVAVPERTPYRPITLTDSEEAAAELEGKSGYFVKKIRSQISGVIPGDVPGGMAGLRSQSLNQIPSSSRRLAGMRDTFTPELPPTLQDPSVHVRPHTHHVQLTSNRGGVSLTSAPDTMQNTHSALLSGGLDVGGDTILAQSGVPLHITDNSEDRYFGAWEGNEPSLDNYFQLAQSQAPSFSGSHVVTQSIPGRSAAHVSKHNRQVNHSRRAQNRNKPTEGEAPLWLQLGGAASASFLLPEGSSLLDATAFNASTTLDAANSLSSLPMATTPLPIPLPVTVKETPTGGDVPIVSMLYARAQSPAMPAAALPSFAFDSAEGLKNALQNNWDGRTIPKYWGTALKQRADERINEPFALKSAQARKQRRAIKAKTAFAAAAAAAAVNSTAFTREETDRQFTMLLDENEHLHETFFDSHLGPYGGADVPFPDHIRRSQSQAQDLIAEQSTFSRPTTAPAFVQNTRRASSAVQRAPEMIRFAIPAAAPAPVQTSTFKGLMHDHQYDDSMLLSNQVEPPFHNITTRIACRSPPDMALHFRRSTAAIAEEIDEAVQREEVDGMFRQSLEIYHKIGFVQKRPLPHATHWVKVVAQYLTSLRSIDELRKRLATLGRAAPRALTTEEAVCVLADTKGIVGQAIDKLKHVEYYAEIKLVCRSINVKSMVHLLEGGTDVYKFKVGEGRSRTVSTEQAFYDGSEHPGFVDTRPGGAMFHGMNEEMLRAATMVVDPYSAQMVEQHHEVVAHKKIREQYDEFSSKIPRAMSARMSSTRSMLSQSPPGPSRSQSIQPEFADGLEEAIAAARTALDAGEYMNRSTAADSLASASTVANTGLFLPAVQPLLHQDSRFVRSRANMVTLGGSISVPSGVEGGEPTSLADAMVAVGGKSTMRSSLRMSVTSPKRASMFTPNSRSSVAGSFSGQSNRLLGAIAAAVAAADSSEDQEARVTGDDAPITGAMRSVRDGSMRINTGQNGTNRSSFKLTPSNAQKQWRKNSGIFEAGSSRTNSSGASPLSRDGGTPKGSTGTPKSARGSSRKSNKPIVSFSTTAGSPWQDLQQRVFFKDGEEGGDDGGAVEGMLETQEEGDAEEEAEDEEEYEYEEQEEDPEPNVAFDISHPWGSKISINPWYLSHQQASPPAQPKVVKLADTRAKQKSYRTANIVQDIFEQEAVGVPFAVMSRRDAERATKDETLARSDKQYIRRSIEMRAAKYQQHA